MLIFSGPTRRRISGSLPLIVIKVAMICTTNALTQLDQLRVSVLFLRGRQYVRPKRMPH
jgi:hypothetical protein